MIRSAAKNHADVLVIVDPNDYAEVRSAITRGGTSWELRHRFAAKAFSHTARYDAAVASYLSSADSEFPDLLNLQFDKARRRCDTARIRISAPRCTRYGGTAQTGTVAGARQLQGRELSYNNVADTDAALECVRVFDEPACVIVKHANPCGVAIGEDLRDRVRKRLCDGSYVCVRRNHRVQSAARRDHARSDGRQQFVEVVIAPEIEAGAMRSSEAPRRTSVLLACGAVGDRGARLRVASGSAAVCWCKRRTKAAWTTAHCKVVTRARRPRAKWPTCCSRGRSRGSSNRMRSSTRKGGADDRHRRRPDEPCRQRENRGVEGRRRRPGVTGFA